MHKRNNLAVILKLLIFLIYVVLLMSACGAPMSRMGEDSGIIINHKLTSKIDVEKYHRVLFAGFITNSTNTFNIVEVANDTYNRELSKNSSFLITFEKPLDLSKTSAKSKEKDFDFKSDNIWEDTILWKKIAGIFNVDLIIAGEISFTNENRTTIERKTTYKDGKENIISKIAELKFFKTVVVFHFISALDSNTITVEKIVKEKGYETTTEESKNIFLALLKETIPDIRSVLISEKEPVRRILLE
jgi:hypothetical protein